MPDPQTLALAAVIFLFAGAVKGVVGMGLPTVSIGLLTAVIGLHEALQLIIVPSLMTNLWQGAVGGRFRALVRRLWPMLVPAFLFTWAGGWALTAVDARILSGTLGIVLAVYSLISLLTPQIPPPGRWERLLSPLVGAVTGIATGAVGSFTVPGALYLQALGLGRDELVQALGIAFTVATVALAISLGGHGLFRADLGLTSALSLAPAALGMIGGQMIRKRLPAETFRKFFFSGLLLLGGYLALMTFA
ncbi:MAG: hypothetical protein COW30_00005 [Rhodospirillales bacterium CG15_BIG_FIL_POST_REV_8_21_14_020_66_15]|nr:MAG: hypothetical protein COW30_00005 [Rhodospirillales bacterium CG15_BIG_FIL_POST_REV_8_21_14_020_66_15]